MREYSIVMPKRLLAKWLKALRSGTIRQGRGKLIDSHGRMCCLGVLEYVAGGNKRCAVEHRSEVPTTEWLGKNGVQFYDYCGSRTSNPTLFMDDRTSTAADLNDESVDRSGSGRHPYTFKKIADIIEANAKGI